MTNWVIADTHFHHFNIIKYCHRPFSSSEDMDDALVLGWNNLVKDEDTVYHLGDFAYGPGSKEKIKRYRSLLNGKIFLVKGNHDTGTNKSYRERGFETVVSGTYLYKANILLPHAPQPFNGFIEGWPALNIHGHIHDLMRVSGMSNHDSYLNVSVEQTNYRPVNLDAIVEDFNRRTYGN